MVNGSWASASEDSRVNSIWIHRASQIAILDRVDS